MLEDEKSVEKKKTYSRVRGIERAIQKPSKLQF